MNYASRKDGNHDQIIKAFEAMGCSVLDLSRVGAGCPDLLVARSGVNVLVEIKDGNKKLRDNQTEFHATWKGKIKVVRAVKDVYDTSFV